MDSDFRLGEWTVAPQLNSLSSQGRTVRLEPKAMQVLTCLADGAQTGNVVSKETLMRTVWAGTFVTDDVLIRCISELRKTFADDPRHPRYIQTIPKGGYRLIAPVIPLGRNAMAVNGLRIAASVPPSSASAAAPASDGRAWRAVLLLLAVAVAAVLAIYVRAKHPLSDHFTSAGPAAPPVATVTSRTSVAILPFQSEAGKGEGDEEEFGVEVADALTTKLSESTRVAAVPTSSVLHYYGSNPDPAAIGQALKVDYVLAGRIDRSRHNVTVEVVRIRDGAALLAATLNQTFSDIFDLEDSLCPRILLDLLVTLDHEDAQRLRKRYTDNPQAYEAFLTAHYFMNKPAREDKAKSIRYFQKAITLDRNYAMAYAGLSDCYMRLAAYGVAPAEFVPKSRAAVMKALEIDDTVAYAHSMLGRIAFSYDWDFNRAAHEYQRARELRPTLVHQWYANYLLVENKPVEAEEENRKFSDFLPFARGVYFPQYYFWVRRYDRAAVMLQKTLEVDPHSEPAHLLLGAVYEQQGRTADAIAEYEKASATSPSAAAATAALGHLYATAGNKAGALAMLKKLDQASRRLYVSPYSRALIFAGLGQKNQAIDELQKAYEERSLLPTTLLFDPRLDRLRTEPRFRDFVRSVGLSQ